MAIRGLDCRYQRGLVGFHALAVLVELAKPCRIAE